MLSTGIMIPTITVGDENDTHCDPNCIYKKAQTDIFIQREFTPAICILYDKELVWYDYWLAYCT